LPEGHTLGRGEWKEDDYRWSVWDAKKSPVGILRVTERALDSDRDLAADLKRQDWPEQVRRHKQCTLWSDGTLRPDG
jgi:hypothetical protein